MRWRASRQEVTERSFFQIHNGSSSAFSYLSTFIRFLQSKKRLGDLLLNISRQLNNKLTQPINWRTTNTAVVMEWSCLVFVYFVLIAKSAKVSKKRQKTTEKGISSSFFFPKKSCIQDLFFLLSDFLAKPSVSFSLTSHCKKMQNIATRIPNVLFCLENHGTQTLGWGYTSIYQLRKTAKKNTNKNWCLASRTTTALILNFIVFCLFTGIFLCGLWKNVSWFITEKCKGPPAPRNVCCHSFFYFPGEESIMAG